MDKSFSSGSLTGSVLLASRYWALHCERAERFAPRAIRPDRDWPVVSLPPAGEREPLADIHRPHPPPHSSVGPCAQPWTARWAPPRPRRGVADMPAVSLAAGFRQGAATGHPGRPPSPPISCSCGHPAAAARLTDMAEPPTIRSAGRPSSI
jgi:hypothetical protein